MVVVSCLCRDPFYIQIHSSLLNPNANSKPSILRFSTNSQRRFSVSASASEPRLQLKQSLVGLAVSCVVFLGFGLRLCHAASAPPVLPRQQQETLQAELDEEKDDKVEKIEDEESDAEFEARKNKSFDLTVPLSIVALQGSTPPSWAKDFIQSQGKRLKFQSRVRGNLEEIYSDLCKDLSGRKLKPTSTVAADIVSLGDSWLSFAIDEAIIEPITGAEKQGWYKDLSEKWKMYLRRNCNGNIDPKGELWAVPYRWGSMVIAYKKSRFDKQKLAPIEDWADLWRPELAGRISMVNSPREVVGAVLKYMGASYNTRNINEQVTGGKDAVQQNLASLGKQVRLFDSDHYLKAFSVGDVWVAVGWSSDILPVAKRMSNVAVIVPKSGASLWADLWAIPAASRLETNKIGGRVRGPSPLIHQWIEFCLQEARAIPFKQEVVPGATPSALESTPSTLPQELTKGKPKLETNLIAGVPPPEILSRCEFLEPLPVETLAEYSSLISNMSKSDRGFFHAVEPYISSVVRTLRPKPT